MKKHSAVYILCRRKQQQGSLLLNHVEGILCLCQLSTYPQICSPVHVCRKVELFKWKQESFLKERNNQVVVEEENPDIYSSCYRDSTKLWVSKAEMAEEMFGGSLRLLLGTDTAVLFLPAYQRKKKCSGAFSWNKLESLREGETDTERREEGGRSGGKTYQQRLCLFYLKGAVIFIINAPELLKHIHTVRLWHGYTHLWRHIAPEKINSNKWLTVQNNCPE